MRGTRAVAGDPPIIPPLSAVASIGRWVALPGHGRASGTQQGGYCGTFLLYGPVLGPLAAALWRLTWRARRDSNPQPSDP